VILTICCTQLCFAVNGQETGIPDKRVTITAKNTSLGFVLKKLAKVSGITIFFSTAEIAPFNNVSVNVKNTPFSEVMQELLESRGLTVIAVNETAVTVTKKNIITSPPPPSYLDTTISVHGRVMNEHGGPVAGATLMVKGTNQGTTTSENGEFEMKHVPRNAYITITSVSFITKLIGVRKSDLGTITLREYVGDLDETVIKGYYNTTKRFNTGNITTIKAKDIAKQPVSDPLLTLQGRVPGMIVTQTTGLQGGAVNVQIRGRSSINNGTQPLFIVDGVPYDQTITAPAGGYYGALGVAMSALNFLNPSDIESIDVLKDADATSIYGSRGANGVILITTKKGRIGATTVNVNVNSGWQRLMNKRNLLNTPQYLQMRREAFKNDGEDPNEQSAPDLLVWDTTRYTDWQKDLLGKTARYTDAQASISGGSPNFQYLMGGNYHRETTIFPGDFSSSRGGVHFNLTGNAFDQRLRVSFTGNYTLSQTDFPGIDFATRIYLPPNTPPPFNDNGSLNWANSTFENPYAQLRSGLLDAQTNNVVSNIDASFRIFPGLIAKVNIGYNELKTNTFSGNLLAGIDPAFLPFSTASADYTTTRIKSFISEPQVSFSRQLGSGRLDALLGTTMMSRKMENQYVNTGGIMDDALIKNPAAASSYYVLGTGNYYKYIAFFAQAGYNLREKYLLNLTYRRDGSSRFGPNKQFASFGSVGAGWIFTQENWVQAHLPFLTFGKIRGSYGITGNDQIGDYEYLDRYEFQNGTYQGVKGVRVIGLFNPDYEWEKTKKMELGIETRLAKDRIGINIVHFRSRSSNQLSPHFLPIITGATSVLGNIPAVIENKGWEAVLTTENLKGNQFSWSTALNISTISNELVSYSGPDINLKAGRPLSVVNLYKSFGVDPLSGTFQFADLEGKPVNVNYGANGFQATVNTAPSFFGGINNDFTFKSLSLDIFFQFVKQKGLKGIYHIENVPGQAKNQPVEVLDRWQKEGDAATLQKYNQNFGLVLDYVYWSTFSDAAYGDASFIRCKNVSLSWQLPGKWKKSIKSNNARLYVNAQNLFTITGYKGWDPETQSVQVIPPVVTVTAGFQLTF
jgi:TonB-linked SusC/RagA family outer membrane protein